MSQNSLKGVACLSMGIVSYQNNNNYRGRVRIGVVCARDFRRAY